MLLFLWQEKMGVHSKVVTVHEKYKKNHHAQNLVDGSGDRSEKTRRISPFEGWWAVLCFSVLLWCLAVGGVWGQTLGQGAAQELIRQNERQRELREQLERDPVVQVPGHALPVDALPVAEAPCFEIRRIELEDETARFSWALAAADVAGDPATGRCLGGKGLCVVMARVQNALIAQGFVTTRVLARTQDLSQGTLVLTLIPGRVRALRISADSDARAMTNRYRRQELHQ